MVRVAQVPVPPRACELAGLNSVDYADAFAVEVPSQRSPVQWIQVAAAASPRLFSAVRVAHRALGLRLAPADSAEHLIGWEVLRDDHDVAVLGNAGLLVTARIVGLTPGDRVMIVSLIQFNGMLGRALWAATAPVHRAVARRAIGQVAAPRSSTSSVGS
jgi:hypothetical protein